MFIYSQPVTKHGDRLSGDRDSSVGLWRCNNLMSDLNDGTQIENRYNSPLSSVGSFVYFQIRALKSVKTGNKNQYDILLQYFLPMLLMPSRRVSICYQTKSAGIGFSHIGPAANLGFKATLPHISSLWRLSDRWRKGAMERAGKKQINTKNTLWKHQVVVRNTKKQQQQNIILN